MWTSALRQAGLVKQAEILKAMSLSDKDLCEETAIPEFHEDNMDFKPDVIEALKKEFNAFISRAQALGLNPVTEILNLYTKVIQAEAKVTAEIAMESVNTFAKKNGLGIRVTGAKIGTETYDGIQFMKACASDVWMYSQSKITTGESSIADTVERAIYRKQKELPYLKRLEYMEEFNGLLPLHELTMYMRQQDDKGWGFDILHINTEIEVVDSNNDKHWLKTTIRFTYGDGYLHASIPSAVRAAEESIFKAVYVALDGLDGNHKYSDELLNDLEVIEKTIDGRDINDMKSIIKEIAERVLNESALIINSNNSEAKNNNNESGGNNMSTKDEKKAVLEYTRPLRDAGLNMQADIMQEMSLSKLKDKDYRTVTKYSGDNNDNYKPEVIEALKKEFHDFLSRTKALETEPVQSLMDIYKDVIRAEVETVSNMVKKTINSFAEKRGLGIKVIRYSLENDIGGIETVKDSADRLFDIAQESEDTIDEWFDDIDNSEYHCWAQRIRNVIEFGGVLPLYELLLCNEYNNFYDSNELVVNIDFDVLDIDRNKYRLSIPYALENTTAHIYSVYDAIEPDVKDAISLLADAALKGNTSSNYSESLIKDLNTLKAACDYLCRDARDTHDKMMIREEIHKVIADEHSKSVAEFDVHEADDYDYLVETFTSRLYGYIRKLGLHKQAEYMEDIVKQSFIRDADGKIIEAYDKWAGEAKYAPKYTKEELLDEVRQLQSAGESLKDMCSSYEMTLRSEIESIILMARRLLLNLMKTRFIPVTVRIKDDRAIRYLMSSSKNIHDIGDLGTYLDFSSKYAAGCIASLEIVNYANNNKCNLEFNVVLKNDVDNLLERLEASAYATFKSMLKAIDEFELSNDENTVIVHPEHMMGRTSREAMHRQFKDGEYYSASLDDLSATDILNCIGRYYYQIDVFEGTGVTYNSISKDINKVPSVESVYKCLADAGMPLQAEAMMNMELRLKYDNALNSEEDESDGPLAREATEWVNKHSFYNGRYPESPERVKLYSLVYSNEVHRTISLAKSTIDALTNKQLEIGGCTYNICDNYMQTMFIGCDDWHSLYESARRVLHGIILDITGYYVNDVGAEVTVRCDGEHKVEFAVPTTDDMGSSYSCVLDTVKCLIRQIGKIENPSPKLLGIKEKLAALSEDELKQIVDKVIAEDIRKNLSGEYSNSTEIGGSSMINYDILRDAGLSTQADILEAMIISDEYCNRKVGENEYSIAVTKYNPNGVYNEDTMKALQEEFKAFEGRTNALGLDTAAELGKLYSNVMCSDVTRALTVAEGICKDMAKRRNINLEFGECKFDAGDIGCIDSYVNDIYYYYKNDLKRASMLLSGIEREEFVKAAVEFKEMAGRFGGMLPLFETTQFADMYCEGTYGGICEDLSVIGSVSMTTDGRPDKKNVDIGPWNADGFAFNGRSTFESHIDDMIYTLSNGYKAEWYNKEEADAGIVSLLDRMVEQKKVVVPDAVLTYNILRDAGLNMQADILEAMSVSTEHYEVEVGGRKYGIAVTKYNPNGAYTEDTMKALQTEFKAFEDRTNVLGLDVANEIGMLYFKLLQSDTLKTLAVAEEACRNVAKRRNINLEFGEYKFEGADSGCCIDRYVNDIYYCKNDISKANAMLCGIECDEFVEATEVFKEMLDRFNGLLPLFETVQFADICCRMEPFGSSEDLSVYGSVSMSCDDKQYEMGTGLGISGAGSLPFNGKSNLGYCAIDMAYDLSDEGKAEWYNEQEIDAEIASILEEKFKKKKVVAPDVVLTYDVLRDAGLNTQADILEAMSISDEYCEVEVGDAKHSIVVTKYNPNGVYTEDTMKALEAEFKAFEYKANALGLDVAHEIGMLYFKLLQSDTIRILSVAEGICKDMAKRQNINLDFGGCTLKGADSGCCIDRYVNDIYYYKNDISKANALLSGVERKEFIGATEVFKEMLGRFNGLLPLLETVQFAEMYCKQSPFGTSEDLSISGSVSMNSDGKQYEMGVCLAIWGAVDIPFNGKTNFKIHVADMIDQLSDEGKAEWYNEQEIDRIIEEKLKQENSSTATKTNSIIESQLEYEELRDVGLVKQAAYMEALIRDNIEVDTAGFVRYKHDWTEYLRSQIRDSKKDKRNGDTAYDIKHIKEDVYTPIYTREEIKAEIENVYSIAGTNKNKIIEAYRSTLVNELNWALGLAAREFVGLMRLKYIGVEVCVTLKADVSSIINGASIDEATTYIDYVEHMDTEFPATMRIENFMNGNKYTVEFGVHLADGVENLSKRMEIAGYKTFQNIVRAVNEMEMTHPNNPVMTNADTMLGRQSKVIDLKYYGDAYIGDRSKVEMSGIIVDAREHELYYDGVGVGLDVSNGPGFTTPLYNMYEEAEFDITRVPSIDEIYNVLADNGLSLQAQCLKDEARGIESEITAQLGHWEDHVPLYLEVDTWHSEHTSEEVIQLYNKVYNGEIWRLLSLTKRVLDLASTTRINADRCLCCINIENNECTFSNDTDYLYDYTYNKSWEHLYRLDTYGESTYALDAYMEIYDDNCEQKVHFALALPIKYEDSWNLELQIYETVKCFIEQLDNVENKTGKTDELKKQLEAVSDDTLKEIIRAVIADSISETDEAIKSLISKGIINSAKADRISTTPYEVLRKAGLNTQADILEAMSHGKDSDSSGISTIRFTNNGCDYSDADIKALKAEFKQFIDRASTVGLHPVEEILKVYTRVEKAEADAIADMAKNIINSIAEKKSLGLRVTGLRVGDIQEYEDEMHDGAFELWERAHDGMDEYTELIDYIMTDGWYGYEGECRLKHAVEFGGMLPLNDFAIFLNCDYFNAMGGGVHADIEFDVVDADGNKYKMADEVQITHCQQHIFTRYGSLKMWATSLIKDMMENEHTESLRGVCSKSLLNDLDAIKEVIDGYRELGIAWAIGSTEIKEDEPSISESVVNKNEGNTVDKNVSTPSNNGSAQTKGTKDNGSIGNSSGVNVVIGGKPVKGLAVEGLIAISPEQLKMIDPDDVIIGVLLADGDSYIPDFNARGIDPVIVLARVIILAKIGIIDLSKSTSDIKSTDIASDKALKIVNDRITEFKGIVTEIVREQCNRVSKLSGLKIGLNCRVVDGLDRHILNGVKHFLAQGSTQLGANATYEDVRDALNKIVKLPDRQMVMTLQAGSKGITTRLQTPIKMLDKLTVYENDKKLVGYKSAMRDTVASKVNKMVYNLALLASWYNTHGNYSTDDITDDLGEQLKGALNDEIQILTADQIHEIRIKNGETLKTAGIDKNVVCAELAKAIIKDIKPNKLNAIETECWE